MDNEALPEGVMLFKLTPKAQAIAKVILQAVKESNISVYQLLQETADVPDSVMNGIVNSKETSLSEHYKTVKNFSTSGQRGRALYMHNKSLIEVVGADLVHKLYLLSAPLCQDVLVNYPLLYESENPKSSNDVLVGSKDSWSPLHQDLPLFCTSVVLVLEGHKEFVLVHDDVVPSLRINLPSSCWEEPIAQKGRTYPDLKSLVHATGGAFITLRSGDMMLMPPRVFHLARNCAPTVSCNFSVCKMDHVPVTVAQTLVRIEQCPRDVMHFDSDFAKLLEDCTTALLQEMPVRVSSLRYATSRKRLPRVKSILDCSVRLMEWYMTLQCIPKGWVEGFWGDLRDRLLDQLQLALPLHNQTISENPTAAADNAGHPVKGASVLSGAGAGGLSGTAGCSGEPFNTAGAPRTLSRSKLMQAKAELAVQQLTNVKGGDRGVLDRSTLSDLMSAEVRLAAISAAGADGGGTTDEAPLTRKRMKLKAG